MDYILVKNINTSRKKLNCRKCGPLITHYSNNLGYDKNTEYECSNFKCLNFAMCARRVMTETNKVQYVVPLCENCSRIYEYYRIDSNVKLVLASQSKCEF